MAYFKLESINNLKLKTELTKIDDGDKKIYLFELEKVDKSKLSKKGLEEYNIMNKALKASEPGENALKGTSIGLSLFSINGIAESWNAISKQFK